MLRKCLIDGKEWQYEEGTQPDGAVELKPRGKKAAVKAVEPSDKAVKPANKARRAVKKK